MSYTVGKVSKIGKLYPAAWFLALLKNVLFILYEATFFFIFLRPRNTQVVKKQRTYPCTIVHPSRIPGSDTRYMCRKDSQPFMRILNFVLPSSIHNIIGKISCRGVAHGKWRMGCRFDYTVLFAASSASCIKSYRRNVLKRVHGSECCTQGRKPSWLNFCRGRPAAAHGHVWESVFPSHCGFGCMLNL